MDLWSINQEAYDKLVQFLIRAKKETYAGKGEETESSRPSSHDLQYEEGELKYIDTYLGGLNFVGEEALWYQNKPIWAMNYAGRVIGEGFSGDFLKEALLLVPKENPYRGPREYKNGENLYVSKVEGDFKWFTGFEEIYHAGIKVYECRYNGSAII